MACSLPLLSSSTSNGTHTIRITQVERNLATLRNQARPMWSADVLAMITLETTDPDVAVGAFPGGGMLRCCGPLRTSLATFQPALGGSEETLTIHSGGTPVPQAGSERRHCTYVVTGDVTSGEWQPEGYGPVQLKV